MFLEHLPSIRKRSKNFTCIYSSLKYYEVCTCIFICRWGSERLSKLLSPIGQQWWKHDANPLSDRSQFLVYKKIIIWSNLPFNRSLWELNEIMYKCLVYCEKSRNSKPIKFVTWWARNHYGRLRAFCFITQVCSGNLTEGWGHLLTNPLCPTQKYTKCTCGRKIYNAISYYSF